MNGKRLFFFFLIGLGLALAASLLLSTIKARGVLRAAPPAWDAMGAASSHQPGGIAVGGVITQSTTWTQADSPVTLIADVIVTDGVTLTIQPGVQVLGNSGTQLQVRGHLEAVGSQPITMTSWANGGPGGWEGLVFLGGTGHLQHVVVRYAGQDNGVSYSSIAVRDVLTGEIRIESSQILSGSHYAFTDFGLDAANGRLIVRDTTFGYNGNSGADVAIRVQAADLHRIELEGNVFQGNNLDRVRIVGGALQGAADLPQQATLEGYQLDSAMVVPAGMTLTIEPGVTVMGDYSAHIEIQGHLDAVGTPTLPILFTSSADDGSGGWEGLYFQGGTGHLRYATVRYAGQSNGFVRAAVALRNVADGQVRIEQSQIISNAHGALGDYGLYVSNSRVRLDASTISWNGNSLADHGLYATAGSTVTLTRGRIEGNAGGGVTLADSQATLTCTVVAENERHGIRLSGGAALIWSVTSSIYDNAGMGLENLSSTLVDVRYNWWGDPSGPYHPTLNPTGLGNEVSDDVLFAPWNQTPTCMFNSFVYLPTIER